MKNNFTYKLTDRIGTLDVFVLGESSFSIEWSRSDDESNFDYKKELSGKMTFVNEGFERLMSLENSVYRCDEQKIEIFKDCNGIQKSVFAGRISLNEAEFNIDKCKIVLKFMKDNKDKCFSDSKNKKINVMPLIQERVVVKPASFVSITETKYCESTRPNEEILFWCETGTPEDGNWTCIFANSYSPDGIHFFTNTTWVREVIELDCLIVPDSDLILIEDNCLTTSKRKFAKKIEKYNCKTTGTSAPDIDGSFNYVYSCEFLGYDSIRSTIDNGFTLKNFLTILLNSVCPELSLKSNFFQINPEIETQTNYVTNKPSTVDNIIVFQKSDVKRPNDAENAWKLETTFENILDSLFKMFNVKFRIIGNKFVIEHVSFFSKEEGFDITSEQLKKYFVGKNSYSYQSEKIPKSERFEFKEQADANWKTEVIYSGCVSANSKENPPSIVDVVTTDIVYILANPEADNKNVVDEGIVFISTKKIGTEYLINSEVTSSGRKLNNVFSFPILFRDFHYYNRPMKTGKVDGVTTEFITTIPLKKGEKFLIPFSVCSGEFNPDSLIKTRIGNGIVDSATYRMKDCSIELNLLYEANQDLTPNIRPTISGGGVFSVYKNTAKIFDVVVGDVDGNVNSIQVLIPPTNGTIEVLSLSQIKYIPNNNFQGFDNFSIRAIDNLSEYSENANFSITVLPANVAPKANDDNFNVFQGESFVQPFSILANDADDFGLISLVTTSATTNQGVSVSIDSAGFFNYIPPIGFEGKDFFDYEIKDDVNNSSFGRVNLNVTYKNKPIGVKDFFQTSKNVVFSADGTIGKESLIANDYSADGVTYSFTATAETKSTVQGGSVVIGTDGLFVYTPPTDFVGIDSFEYQVNNVNGSGIGEVEIAVIPVIYVKLKLSNLTIIGRVEDDYFAKKQNYTLQFFSNSEGTTPFNVSGLNFKVKIKENLQTKIDDVEDQNVDFEYFTGSLNGTTKTILENFLFFEIEKVGETRRELYRTVTIQPSSTYQII